nr:flippase [uncultured Emticicia sp.]
MTENKGLLRNIASLGVVQVANYIFPLITVPLISRIIGPDKFGVINYASAFVAYFTLIIGYGFDLTATRRISKDPNNIDLRNRVFSEVFTTQIVLFAISIFLFLGCIFIIPPIRAEKLVAIFTFLVCISTVFTQNWLFQAMQDLPKIAWLNFITKLFFTFTVLLVIKEKQDYIWQPLIASLIQIFVGLISFFWAYNKYQLRLISISIEDVWQLLKNERTVFFSMVVISLYTTTNIVILGIMQNETQVGFYSAGQRLMDIARSVISMPLAMALFPFIGKAFGESFEKGLLMVHKILPIIVLFTGLMGIGMLIFGPMALRFFYGKKFEPAIPVFQILAFIPMIIALSNVFGIQIMMNLKMDKLFFKITASGAILSVLLNILLIKKYGYIGTAIDWLITEIFITLAMYIALRNNGINPIGIDRFNILTIKEQVSPILNKMFGKK